jgi:pyridoxamine 5'-phosphate oxidase
VALSDNGPDPLQVVSQWLHAARDAGDPLPDAMTLATIGIDGCPAARLVMLRGLDAGMVFYTDRDSAKGDELAACPKAAVVLHWLAPSHRQVRATGPVEVVSDEEADGYWRTRRPEVRWTGAAWTQSEVVSSRTVLQRRLSEWQRRYPDSADVPRPGRWCGFRIVPTMIEFWQEDPDGLHDRLRYRRSGGGWTQERLTP